MDIAHICIKTRNLNKTECFYTNILGMEKVFDFFLKENRFFNKKRIGFYLKFGNNNFIEVFQNFGFPRFRGKIDHFCFAVDSIDKYEKILNNHNIKTKRKSLLKITPGNYGLMIQMVLK